MHRLWILVSDSTTARICTSRGNTLRDWALVEELKHPESRAKVSDLVTAAPGRAHPLGKGGDAHRAGGTGKYGVAYNPRTDPHVVEVERFATIVCNRLNTGFERSEYDSLVLVSAPHFLGLVRAGLSPQVWKHLVDTVDKDLSRVSERELRERLHLIVKHAAALARTARA